MLFSDWFCQRFDGFGQRMALVGRMQIKIDAAQWPRRIVLTEDDSDLLIKGDTVAEIRSSTFVGLDGLFYQ